MLVLLLFSKLFLPRIPTIVSPNLPFLLPYSDLRARLELAIDHMLSACAQTDCLSDAEVEEQQAGGGGQEEEDDDGGRRSVRGILRT